MKNTIIAAFSTLVLMTWTSGVQAQEDRSKRPSPPIEVTATIDGANVSINYSSPAVKDRLIWGGLVPYGKIWRSGANEATVFEVDTNIIIGNQRLPAGKYALFTIPGESKWTVVLNSDFNQWGAYKYDVSKDVIRFDATPKKSLVFNERLKYTIEDKTVSLFWENLQLDFNIGE